MTVQWLLFSSTDLILATIVFSEHTRRHCFSLCLNSRIRLSSALGGPVHCTLSIPGLNAQLCPALLKLCRLFCVLCDLLFIVIEALFHASGCPAGTGLWIPSFTLSFLSRVVMLSIISCYILELLRCTEANSTQLYW